MKAAWKLSFPSSPRPKTYYRQAPIEREQETTPKDTGLIGMENAVRLQLYMLIYQLLHIARCTLHSAPQVVEIEIKEVPSVPCPESMGTIAEVTDLSTDPDSDAVLEEKPHMHLQVAGAESGGLHRTL